MAVLKGKRLPMFDELRGLAIIGVIAIHAAAHDTVSPSTSFGYWLLVIQIMLSRFAVPSFLIISGFLVSYKESDLQETLKIDMIRRIKRVIFPYTIWSSLYFFIFLFMGIQYFRNPAIIFLEKLITGSVVLHLYFLVLIIQMYVLSYYGFMKNGRAGKMVIILVVLAFIAFVFPSYLLAIDATALNESKIGYYFKALERSFFPRWLLFFMFGRWMGAHWSSIKNFFDENRRFLSLALFISFVLCWLDFFSLRFWSGNQHLLPPDWMVSFVVFGSFFSVWFLTLRVHTNLMLEWLAKLGGVSFGVYLLHEPFLSLLMASDFWQSYVGVLPNACIRQSIAILAGLSIPIFIFAILQYFLPTGLKRYLLG